MNALHDRQKCVLVRDRRIARFAREEQLRINAVLVLLLQPLLRRPRADSVVEIQSHGGKCFQRFPGELIGSPECDRPSLFDDDVVAVRQFDPPRRAFAVGSRELGASTYPAGTRNGYRQKNSDIAEPRVNPPRVYALLFAIAIMIYGSRYRGIPIAGRLKTADLPVCGLRSSVS